MNFRTQLAIALTFLVSIVFAQDQDEDQLDLQELDEVVVTDSRFELKRENSGKTVIKIDQEELNLSLVAA